MIERLAEEQRQQVREAIKLVLGGNITLHSIRQGYGVFNITSFEKIISEILNLKYPNGQPMMMIGIMDENQGVPKSKGIRE